MTTVRAPLTLRVMVTDVWEMVDVSAAPEMPVAELKRHVLERAMQRDVRDGDYEVKYAGALVTDESVTLAGLGVRAGAPLIVLPRHRRPVR